MTTEVLISEQYAAEQKRMHVEIEDYGIECLQYADTIAKIILDRGITSLLDYGSGKGRLVPALTESFQRADKQIELEVNLYDPGVPQFSEPPDPAQLVTCIDVLEHVEPQYTIGVLYDLRRCTEKIAFITIGLTPASKTLSDGRNAHINLRPADEWIRMLLEHFSLVYAVNKGRSLLFVGKPK